MIGNNPYAEGDQIARRKRGKSKVKNTKEDSTGSLSPDRNLTSINSQKGPQPQRVVFGKSLPQEDPARRFGTTIYNK